VVAETGTNGLIRHPDEFMPSRLPPISIVCHPGATRAAALNAALCEVREEIVFFLFSGDILLPNAAGYFTTLFRESPAAVAAYGRVVQQRADGTLVPSREKRMPRGDLLKHVLHGEIDLPISAIACRKTVFDAGLGFRHDCPCAELDFIVELANRYELECVQEDVVILGAGHAEPTPLYLSTRCLALTEWATRPQRRLETPKLRQVLAIHEYRAACAWSKSGDVRRAFAHAQQAVRLDPNPWRYWLLLTVLRSKLILTGQRGAIHRAA
jgi:hypothetical protein